MSKSPDPVHVIGGGLAGSEATWQLVQQGVPVILHEMRPVRGTDAHITDTLAELVCSNSFRSDDAQNNAVGLLHREMRELGSIIMQSADENRVPAGGALAVDRHGFSAAVQEKLLAHPLVTVERGEVEGLPPAEWGNCLIATGPLTSEKLAQEIHAATGADALSFFDAIAPIVYKDSINFDIAWFQSRYDKGDGTDYINCPLTEEQYREFIQDLNEGDKTDFKEWEKDTPYFDGCLPIEVMAERGPETLRYGPMKPVGLTNPNNPNVKPMPLSSCVRITNSEPCIISLASRPSSNMRNRPAYSVKFRGWKKLSLLALEACIAIPSLTAPKFSMKSCALKRGPTSVLQDR